MISADTASKQLVDFFDQIFIGSNIVEKTLWDKYATVVLPLVSSVNNKITDAIDDVDEGLTSVRCFFRNDNQVRMSLHSAL